MTRSGMLLAIEPEGTHRAVPNTYEGIKDGLRGATLCLVYLPDGENTLFVDDNGMLESAVLNVPASILAQQVLYGPVVLAGGADDEGETLPPSEKLVTAAVALASVWTRVCLDAVAKGQAILAVANADTVPPARLIALTDEMFETWMETGVIPEADDE